MAVVFFLLSFASVVALVLGLIKPRLVIHWGHRRTRKMAALIYSVAAIVFLFAIGATGASTENTNPPPSNKVSKNNTTVSSNSTANEIATTTNVVSNTSAGNSVSNNATTNTDSNQASVNNTAGPVPTNNTSSSSGSTSSTSKNSTKKTTNTSSNTSNTSNVCRSNWSAGVYHTYRFNLINPCKTVSGTVEIVRHEADHDYHLDIKLDSQYKNLLASGNYKYQHGYLVVEIIPMDQPYVTIPHVGQHATFTGAVVDDKDHGWNEVHPAWLVNGKGKLSYTKAAARKSVVTGICGNGDSDCPTSSSSSSSGSSNTTSKSNTTSSSTGNLTIVSSSLTRNPGQYASIKVKTKPNVQGTIEVDYSSGPSHSSSLNPKTADPNGYITWTWKVGSRTTPGNWPVTITADRQTVKTTLHLK
ncbi:hypothetical protein [Alicyclobacillus sp. SO9]|uniref:hypothetical protein n=1 Tax=Alicyclobacillus sp. SO9 TaxID=2665646 RepID=UPI0018E85AD0|nr:hypothetical protein [Alicyclobacillus sp. SO9]QQE80424.1 hypothetical protein GI364_08425 [Alicyclobacillus sp. SO9]